jgi:antitoxin (DNA-binding transcriptional repressor) of toxin-antitoxin stability system
MAPVIIADSRPIKQALSELVFRAIAGAAVLITASGALVWLRDEFRA